MENKASVKGLYDKLQTQMKTVSVSPIEDVLSPEEIERISQYREMGECHYNAFWTAFLLNDVEYCEGYGECLTHAICYHKSSGRYFDPTWNREYEFNLLLQIGDIKWLCEVYRSRGMNFLMFDNLWRLNENEIESLMNL